MHHPPRVFISVAEQSADEHAAGLIRAFQSRYPGAVFHGLAGTEMQAAGCGCLHDMTKRSAMAAAALLRVPEALRLVSRIKKHFDEARYDAAVMIDSPALNLPIANICRARGIPVLYYIAPQTWAWGWARWRNSRLRARVNRVACIWPFEVEHFRKAGIQATYVGHPSFDRLTTIHADEARVARLREGATPVITLLPGSREHVIEEVLPGQLEIARAIGSVHRRARFNIVAANDQVRELILRRLSDSRSTPKCDVMMGDSERSAAIRAADLVLTASGTVTLEVMYHATPMIVMYNTARWGYQLVGRWLIKTPYLSLPNIIAGRQIVPEFMPYYRTTDPIKARALEWLATPTTMERVRKELRETITPIAKSGAAANAANELEALMGR